MMSRLVRRYANNNNNNINNKEDDCDDGCKHANSPLLAYCRDNTSQGGEDGIIHYLFHSLSLPFSSSTTTSSLSSLESKTKRYCVDVGAWDGQHLSNTYSLLQSHAWGGLLIEADHERFQALSQLYASREDVHCIDSFVELTGANTLVKYLQDYDVPVDFDFLSIDIDGADYYIWQSLQRLYSPKIVCIEFNPTISNRVYYRQEPNSRVHQGSSLLALVELGKELGYTLIATTTFNAFFIHNQYVSLLGFDPSNYTLDDFNPCSMVTEIFQTYEGELKYVGPQKLLWHRLAMNPQKLQVLTKKQRYFPFAPPASSSISQGIAASSGSSSASSSNACKEVIDALRQILSSFNESPSSQHCNCSRGNVIAVNDDSWHVVDDQVLSSPVRISPTNSKSTESSVCLPCSNVIAERMRVFLTACQALMVVQCFETFCIDAMAVVVVKYASLQDLWTADWSALPSSPGIELGTEAIRVNKVDIFCRILSMVSATLRERAIAMDTAHQDSTLEFMQLVQGISLILPHVQSHDQISKLERQLMVEDCIFLARMSRLKSSWLACFTHLRLAATFANMKLLGESSDAIGTVTGDKVTTPNSSLQLARSIEAEFKKLKFKVIDIEKEMLATFPAVIDSATIEPKPLILAPSEGAIATTEKSDSQAVGKSGMVSSSSDRSGGKPTSSKKSTNPPSASIVPAPNLPSLEVPPADSDLRGAFHDLQAQYAALKESHERKFFQGAITGATAAAIAISLVSALYRLTSKK